MTETEVKMKHVKGSIFASDKEAADNPFVRHRLYYAFKENGLHDVVFRSTWSDNHITFDSSIPTTGTQDEALEFIHNLRAVMNTEDALLLGLHGRFSLVVESREEPLVFRITVEKGGAVSYQQAAYTWPEATVVTS